MLNLTALTSRRNFIRSGLALAATGLTAACGARSAPAALPARLRRIGVLANGTPASAAPNVEAFRKGLAELGHVEGSDLTLELRYTEGRLERYAEMTTELAGLGVDVIVVAGEEGIRAARDVTSTIPIVFATAGPDPVATGIVSSLARPGGNVTGLTLYAGQEHAKRLQLLTEAVSGLSRVAVLSQGGDDYLRETEEAAHGLGIQIVPLELRSGDEVEKVLDGAVAAQTDGLVVTAGAPLSVVAPRIVAWAAEHRMPAIYAISSFISPGGLMTYAASLSANWGRASSYVDRILRGSNPGDLPVEKPTSFDFVVNLKTAQALGISISPSVLIQATVVIQ